MFRAILLLQSIFHAVYFFYNVYLLPLPSEKEKNLHGFKDVCLKNGSSQCHNQALILLFVPFSLDSDIPARCYNVWEVELVADDLTLFFVRNTSRLPNLISQLV